MPALPAQLFVPESAAEIRDMMLMDHRLASIAAGATEPAVQPGTDDYIFYTAVANCSFLEYGNIAQTRSAISPLDAVGDDLERWRDALQLPEVEPAGSTGLITVTVTGTATIPDGTELVLPSGLRLRTVGPHVGIADGADVSIEAIDTGSDTNADSGTAVRFVSAPTNVATEARVSVNGPLTGGADEEDEARLRERILNELRYGPGGGNWGHARKIAFETLPSVTGCWAYPALGGPGSWKLVIAKSFDRDRNDYSREMSSAAVLKVRTAIHSEYPDQIENVVSTVNDQAAALAVKIKIPNSVLAGGDGRGWLDASPWPTAAGNKTAVTVVTSSTQITVDHANVTGATGGLTRIAWWSPRDMKFRVFQVLSCTGGSGAWVLTVDSPMVDSTGALVTVGDYISPAAVNTEAYGDAIIDMFEALAAGENTADIARLPRAARHPFTVDDAPEEITERLLNEHLGKPAFAEITKLATTYLPVASPTVPGSIDTAPNVLTPSNLGIYPWV